MDNEMDKDNVRPCGRSGMCAACMTKGGCSMICDLTAETAHHTVMLEADAALNGAAVAMAEADEIADDGWANHDPYAGIDDWPPAEDILNEARSQRATAFDDDPYLLYDEEEDLLCYEDKPKQGEIIRRNGTVFRADIDGDVPNGGFGQRWEDLRPVKPRPNRSLHVRIQSNKFERRIRQLATSWQCSIQEAENRFFGWKLDRRHQVIDLKKPRHLFPVRRTRKFED